MELKNLTCISENVSLKDYYELYNYVRENMEFPEWLGLIPITETENILNAGGKIWLYYDQDIPVCSVFYIPVKNKTLRKHNIETDETETGSLGPIMVRKEYNGNGLMSQMLIVFNEYNKNIGNSYVFTKVVKDNIYSLRNMIKDGYEVTHEYENERGTNLALIKKL